MIARVMMVAVFLLAMSQQPEPQTVFPSPRLAAVAFAMAHGFDIPRTNLIVANEVETGQVNDVPKTANDRARSLPLEETMRDSQAVARLLGPAVKTAPVAQLVQCPQMRCYGSSTRWALLVDDLKNDSMGVYVKLYSPAPNPGDHGTLLQSIIETARVPTGWVAKGFKLAPQTVNVR